MRCRNLNCFASVGAAAALAFLVAAYDQARALGQPSDDVLREPLPADSQAAPIGPPEPGAQSWAFLAYSKAIEGFKSGEFKDPEVVYRWSMRLMKAEQKLKVAEPAEREHLRRMTELAEIIRATAKDGSDQEMKFWAANYYEHEAKEIVKEAKLAKITKLRGQGDNAASSPHDAAIAVAESYLNAALKGDTEAAVKLAAPGSLAASKRMLDNFKDLGKQLADGRMKVKAIQMSGQEKITIQTEVQFTDATSDGRATGEFVVELKQANGRWLVTNFAANKTPFPTAMSRPSPLGQSRNEPAPDSAPKQTKVFLLKHAQAQEILQTISELLALNNRQAEVEIRMAADARTNRVLAHGTREKLEQVEVLIQELDVPGVVKKTEIPREDPKSSTTRLPPELKP